MDRLKKSNPIGAVIVLAHKRTDHLERVLESLNASQQFEDFPRVAVIDEGNDRVRKLVRDLFSPHCIIELRAEPELASRTRILRSLRHGLSWAFETTRADYAVVIEDDVIVSSDFQSFVHQCMVDHMGNRLFRAVNGFGLGIPESGTDTGEVKTSRLSYGVGWGWALPRRSYSHVRRFLEVRGDYHVWDSLIEPYFRTGYVVNPRVSKILNIGFDSTATHTSVLEGSAIGQELRASFSSDVPISNPTPSLVRSRDSFRWREDAIALDALPLHGRLLVYGTGRIFFYIHLARIFLQECNKPFLAMKLQIPLRLIRKRVFPMFGRLSGSTSVFE